jgi:glycosyltransferase involved in cell wall biosynthesis
LTQVKVLLTVDGLWVGGTERSMSEMLPFLSRMDVDVSFVCLRRRDEGVEASTLAQGTPTRFLSSTSIAGQVKEMRAVLRSERPDIVHTALFRASLVARLAAAGLPCKVLTSLVNTPYEPVRAADPSVRPLALSVIRRIDALLGRYLTDHFHAVSRAARDSAIARLGVPAERITVVERGRDTLRLGAPSIARRRAARVALGLADTDEVLVTVGRQDYQKGFDLLLDAIGRLRHRGALVLLVAGREGSMTNRLQAQVRELDLGGRVRFLGHRDDVPEILAASELFVFPSRFEGFPGAVLEAMALGLPVVASGIAPVREILDPGEHGILVDPIDASGFAGAIETMLTDRQRADAMGARNRVRFLERFTQDRSAGRMGALYRRLADAEAVSTR